MPTTLTQPILVTTNNYLLDMKLPDQRFGDKLIVNYEGPAILIAPPQNSSHGWPDVSTGALKLYAKRQQWYDLSDAVAWDINGLSSLCVDFNIYANPGADGTIVSSAGKQFTIPGWPRDSALRIARNSGNLVAYVTTTFGRYTVSAPLVDSQWINVRVNYDGASLVLYLNGVEVSRVDGASGTIVQTPWEWVCLSGLSDYWHASFAEDGFDGYIKQLKLSDGVVVQGNFDYTQTQNSWVPSRDRFFMACDTTYGPCVLYRSRWSGSGFLVMRSNTYAPYSQSRATIRNVEIDCNSLYSSGIFGVGAVELQVENVSQFGGRHGLYLSNNSYTTYVNNYFCDTLNRGRAGILNLTASGNQIINHARIYGSRFGIYLGGCSMGFRDGYIVPAFAGVWSQTLSNPGCLLDLSGTRITQEGTNANYIFVGSYINALCWHFGGWSAMRNAPIVYRGANPNFSVLSVEDVHPTGLPMFDNQGV
jgi:hypothetical protein